MLESYALLVLTAMKQGDEVLNASSFRFSEALSGPSLHGSDFLLGAKCLRLLLFKESHHLMFHCHYFLKITAHLCSQKIHKKHRGQSRPMCLPNSGLLIDFMAFVSCFASFPLSADITLFLGWIGLETKLKTNGTCTKLPTR